MFQLMVKNFIRLFVGYFSTFLPFFTRDTFRLYCNLVNGKGDGGPTRFLLNISSSMTQKKNLEISNWSLSGCQSALVFSASWGKSFAKICKRNKIYTVLRVDGFYVPADKLDPEYALNLDYQKWVNQRLAEDLESFDHIIYQSQFSKDICDRYLFRRIDNYSIIPNGTNIKHFTPSSSKSSGPLKIVILAKHYPKHLKLAIEVLKRVLRERDVRLKIIGPMRDGADRVKEVVQSFNLDQTLMEKIELVGSLSFKELPETLRGADILLHAKVGDWCPNAVLEAMACGLPVVCPSWGGTKELVGAAGVIVDGPEWDINDSLIEGMAKGIMQIQDNLLEYKQEARNRVEAHFNIDEVSKKYLRVLKYKV